MRFWNPVIKIARGFIQAAHEALDKGKRKLKTKWESCILDGYSTWSFMLYEK